MIQQRFGNNIPIRIILSVPGGMAGRKADVTVFRKNGRVLAFSYGQHDNLLYGIIFGMDMPKREDVLSFRVIIDKDTERQQIIDIPDVVRLVSSSQQATLVGQQAIVITTDGHYSRIFASEPPRTPHERSTPHPQPSTLNAQRLNTHETMAPGATPDVTLS